MDDGEPRCRRERRRPDAGAGAALRGATAVRKPAADWVPDQTCTGWVAGESSVRRGARRQASRRPAAAGTQVSRLGNPLVNEVVIGLNGKDIFNASEPSGDAQFLGYVTHPVAAGH